MSLERKAFIMMLASSKNKGGLELSLRRPVRPCWLDERHAETGRSLRMSIVQTKKTHALYVLALRPSRCCSCRLHVGLVAKRFASDVAEPQMPIGIAAEFVHSAPRQSPRK